MYNELEQGKISELDEDTLNSMHDYIIDQLGSADIIQYEISNFAKPGYESKHNSSYWNETPYIGLGAGAHSYDGADIRRWNICDADIYINSVNKAFSTGSAQYLPFEIERLGRAERHNEVVMLSLRTSAGLNINNIAGSERATLIEKAEQYRIKGLLSKQGDCYIATRQGQHILNRIIEDLMI